MLDFLNKDLGSSDPLARLSVSELHALEESLLLQMDATNLVSAGDRLSFVETQQAVKPLLSQIVAVRLELSKREARWKYERKGFWVAAFIGIMALLFFMLWLLDLLLHMSSRGP